MRVAAAPPPPPPRAQPLPAAHPLPAQSLVLTPLTPLAPQPLPPAPQAASPPVAALTDDSVLEPLLLLLMLPLAALLPAPLLPGACSGGASWRAAGAAAGAGGRRPAVRPSRMYLGEVLDLNSFATCDLCTSKLFKQAAQAGLSCNPGPLRQLAAAKGVQSTTATHRKLPSMHAPPPRQRAAARPSMKKGI